MDILEGKKILFFCYAYRNYNKYIIDILTSFGANVVYFSDSPDYFLFKKAPKPIKHIVIKIYNSIILWKIRKIEFDYVFVIKGTFLKSSFIKQLKEKNSNARFLMYQWDSLKNHDYSSKVEFFDKVFSFDRNDCKELNSVNYQPLFYIDLFNNINKEKRKRYDLFFIGSGINQRKPILLSLINSFEQPKTKCVFYFISWKLFIKSLFFKEEHFKYLYKPISHKKFINQFIEAKAVIDIQNENQSGLTMRTFEVLGAGIKLVTTNANIKLEPFYNSKNILVIDRINPVITIDFINSNVEPLDMSDYTLEAFLEKIFR